MFHDPCSSPSSIHIYICSHLLSRTLISEKNCLDRLLDRGAWEGEGGREGGGEEIRAFKAKTIYANLARFSIVYRVSSIVSSHVRRYYTKCNTLHFKITEHRGELSERKNGGSDEAARTPARATAPSRHAQNDGDAALALAEQQESSSFQLGQLEPVRRQQSTVRRRFRQHRHRYT